MKDKHTPTPWRVGPDQSSVKVGRYNVVPYVTAGGTAKGMIDEREVVHANAAFIVRACNSHDQLVLALRRCLMRIKEECADPEYLDCVISAEEILAAAGEQS